MTRGGRWYRAALRLTPRSHRERFGDQEAQLYDDLVATGQLPWRLWAQLPLDLLRVRAWTLPFSRLQTAGAPTAVAAVERTALQAALRVVAVLAHLSWLTTHLVIAYPWWLEQRRATEMLGHSPTFEDWARYPYSWGPDPLIDLADERAGAALPYLLLSFPVVAILSRWLPRKGSFAVLWVVAWPLGMYMLAGYGLALAA